MTGYSLISQPVSYNLVQLDTKASFRQSSSTVINLFDLVLLATAGAQVHIHGLPTYCAWQNDIKSGMVAHTLVVSIGAQEPKVILSHSVRSRWAWITDQKLTTNSSKHLDPIRPQGTGHSGPSRNTRFQRETKSHLFSRGWSRPSGALIKPAPY